MKSSSVSEWRQFLIDMGWDAPNSFTYEKKRVKALLKSLSTSKYILSTANIDSGKEWESILKLGIVDEDEGTITFSYNELVNLLEGK